MPNIKSAEKRVKVIKKKTLENKIVKTALKTSIKKCKEAIAHKESAAVQLVNDAVRSIDKSVKKNILHKNTAARRKSKIMKALNLVK